MRDYIEKQMKISEQQALPAGDSRNRKLKNCVDDLKRLYEDASDDYEVDVQPLLERLSHIQ